ncbi:MAG: proline racemase family protein [Microbacteriaceae bacterium]
MILDLVIHTADSHTEGNPTRVVLSGFGVIPGATILEKRDYVRNNLDDLRRMILHEPRGGALNCAVLRLDPCDPRADVAAVIMEQAEYVPMCGHCIIGFATTLVELGLVKRQTPTTRIVIETVAGLVTAMVDTSTGRTGAVTLENVPSFVVSEGVELTMADGITVTADISFGGDFYICVPAADLGLSLSPASPAEILQRAAQVRHAARALVVRHPEREDLDKIYMVSFYEELSRSPVHYRNVIVAPPAAIDRSPCGTGTSAMLARLYRRGILGVGDAFVNEGILGTTFEGRVARSVDIGEVAAIIPEITGRAYMTGFHDWVRDPEDPFPAGFLLE